MPVLYTNNATSTLAASITNVATSMSVASGQGARFPAPGGSDYFYATLSDSAGNIEIVKVTARSTDTLTIVRAQDGTSARAWAAGDAFELRMVRAMLDDFKTDTRGSITTAAMGGNTVYLLGTTSSSAGTSQPLVGSGLSYNATNGTLTVPGGTVLHASNYSSYALPATGGTLTGNLTVAGDITIGSAKRYLGDFSNLTVASRGIFQSNTTNGSTFVTAMPNGTGTATQYQAYNSSDPANASFGSIGVTANQVRIVSSNTGTGSLNPITFLFGTTEVARFTTSGDLLIGTTTDDGVNLLQVTGGTALTGALTIRAANELRLADTDSSNYVGFKSPGTVSTNVIWTLPATDGTSGQYMVTNGTGTLSWASPGASLTGLTQSSGSFVTSLGSGAGQSGSGGAVTIGYQAGQSNSYGGGGVHIGYQAGKASIGGNITIGSSAGVALGYGPYCTIIGTSAATSITSASYNTIIGAEAAKQAGNIDHLTAIGNMSGFYASGNASTLLGSNAGYYSGGIERVALGAYSMRGSPSWNSTGAYSVGVGAYTLYNYTSGEKNVAVGHSALYSATTAKWNVAVGHNAGYGVTTGNNNTLIGYLAGNGTNALTSGTNNICIGYTADASAATVSNEITIGNSSNTVYRVPGVGYQITTQSIGYGTTNPNSFGDANRKHLVVLNGDQNVTLGAYYQAGVGQYAYMSSGSGTNGAQPLHLQIAGTSRFIIGTDGNCFVNATSLDVGNGIAGEKQIWLRNTNRSTYFYLSNSDSAIGIWDATGSFSRWYSTTTGNFVIAGTLTQNSDERIKTNWRSLAADFIDRLAQVKSGVYDRTDLPDTSVGVSAQDMQALLPQSVLADSRGYLSVAYASTALVAAVELSKRLIALEQRVDQLLAQ